MRKPVLTFLVMILATSLSAQDLVIKTNNDTVQCIVVDVTYRFVKCISYPGQEGPVYNILKEDVYMIRYADGKELLIQTEMPEEDAYRNLPLTYTSGFRGIVIRQGDRELTKPDVRYIFSNYPDALAKYNSGKSMKVVANVIALPSAFALGWQVGTMIAGGQPNGTVMIIGGAGLIVGIVLDIAGGNKIRQAISIYNSEIKATSKLQMNAGFTKHGIGITLSF